jgi:hypothetical protein
VWDVASVCDVPDACEGHLLGEGLAKAGQALGDLTAQQGGGTPRIHIILNNPLKRPATHKATQQKKIKNKAIQSQLLACWMFFQIT